MKIVNLFGQSHGDRAALLCGATSRDLTYHVWLSIFINLAVRVGCSGMGAGLAIFGVCGCCSTL